MKCVAENSPIKTVCLSQTLLVHFVVFQTACFELPTSATHGMHLLCSYPTCRSAGVKFRYCLFCKKPVTKQNFRSRHLHAELDTAGVESASSSIVSAEGCGLVAPATVTAKKRIPKKRPASLETAETPSAVVVPALFKAQPQRILDEDEEDAPILTAPQARPMVPKVMMAFPPATKRPSVDDALRKIMRRRRWNSLLSERPSGFQNMDSWMAEVIAVSDTSKVFAPSASNLSDGGVGGKTSVDQLARWGALLAERPVSSAHGAVTAWLTKVLSISCPSAASKDTEETAVLISHQGLADTVNATVRANEDGELDATNVAAASDVHRSAKRLKSTGH
jgi:hypothetical protein